MEARSADAVTAARARVIQAVERATASFGEVQQQLAEGGAFYADLVGRLLQMEQTIAGFAYAQVREARKELGIIWDGICFFFRRRVTAICL